MHCSRSRRRSREPALSLTTKQFDIIGIGAAQQLPTYIEETCRVAHALGPEDRDPYQGLVANVPSAAAVSANVDLKRTTPRFLTNSSQLAPECPPR